MATIQKLYKFRDRAQELQATVSAHKHTIVQLLDRIAIFERQASERNSKHNAYQEALLVKQMKALKKALAKAAAYKTSKQQAEHRLLRAEAEKQELRDQVKEMQRTIMVTAAKSSL
jgi:hypothetical protein